MSQCGGNTAYCTYNFCITKKKCFEESRKAMKAKWKPQQATVIKTVKKKKKLSHQARYARRKQKEREYWATIHPKRVVTLIMRKHDAACACCYTLEDLTFDHVIPLSLGGSNKWTNGQVLCSYCNRLKASELFTISELQHKYDQNKLKRIT